MRTLGRWITLALFSAVTAEFLLGDQWLGGVSGPGQQLSQLVLFTAFYGSAAVLIREVARRTGRGWPTMLALAFAFGVIEEGIVDQSLFNPDFAGQRLLDPGYISWLGIGAPWTIFVLTLHVVWSMGAPIAIAEAMFPSPLGGQVAVAPQLQAPWLRLPTIVLAIALYLLGGTAIFVFSAMSGFMASSAQLIASLVIAAIVIIAAVLLPRRAPRARRPFWPAVIVGLVLSSAIQVVSDLALSPWLICGVFLLIILGGIAVITRGQLDVTGLAVGAVLTYDWLGMSKALPLGMGPTLEQSALVVVVLACVLIAVRRSVITRRRGAP